MELIQKKGIQSRKVKITENGIIYRFKDWTEESEYTITYEEIYLNMISRQRKNELSFIIIGVLFLLFSAASFIAEFNSDDPKASGYSFSGFLLLIAIGFGILHLLLGTRMKIYIPLSQNRRISLLQDKPSMEEVNSFIAELTKASNNYLRRKYLNKSNRLPVSEQIEQLDWLLDRNVITIDDYEELREKIYRNSGNSNIGFASRDDLHSQ